LCNVKKMATVGSVCLVIGLMALTNEVLNRRLSRYGHDSEEKDMQHISGHFTI